MQMLQKDGYTVCLAKEPAPGAALPAVWMHLGAPEEAQAVAAAVHTPCALLCVCGCRWERDFTPWPAPALPGGEAFTGGAAAYLAFFTQTLLPLGEGMLPAPCTQRALAGYSLAGLFAAWALYETPFFARTACVSASLWYDGFAAWAQARADAAPGTPLYVSLGDREQNTRSPRMAAVQSATQQLCAHWRQTHPLTYETNPGGHFFEPERRLAKAVDTLLAMR